MVKRFIFNGLSIGFAILCFIMALVTINSAASHHYSEISKGVLLTLLFLCISIMLLWLQEEE